MARKLRVQYPGAIYHAMNRGDHSEKIFLEPSDRELWLATLSEACQKTEWQIHSFCLMANHFHLVLETPHGGGKEWQQTAEQKALRILADELRCRGWSDADLDRRRKGDLEKLSIARRLRAETTMTLSWIAQRLKMGAAGSLANCLRANPR